MLITILMYIFSNILSFIFVGLIWSQNLKFSKLTKIWYRGTLVYAYYDFNIIFSNFLSVTSSWANFVSKPEFLEIDRNLVQGYCILYTYYNFNVYFFKSFVTHIILGKFGPNI